MIPRLHVVTDDEVLAGGRFLPTAAALARSFGADLALHVRGHATPGGRLHVLVSELEEAIEGTRTLLLVADRVDVALASEGAGVRMGAPSIPTAAARALLGPGRVLACSVHGLEAARAAADAGADVLVLGTIWETASHPGRPGAGTGLVREVAERVDAPVVAIGGVTPERAVRAMEAGAAGVAVLSGVWAAADPVASAGAFLAVMAAPQAVRPGEATGGAGPGRPEGRP